MFTFALNKIKLIMKFLINAILFQRSRLEIWTPQNFTIANFGHPVSKSWVRPWPPLATSPTVKLYD